MRDGGGRGCRRRRREETKRQRKGREGEMKKND
jgi:hypothetical protein